MFHFTSISKNDREVHLIAYGSQAFKAYSQILRDKMVQGCHLKTMPFSASNSFVDDFSHKKQLFLALISDLEPGNVGRLCRYIMEARLRYSYVIGEVMALDDDPNYDRSVTRLKNSFDELIELNDFLVVDSAELHPIEKQTFLSCKLTKQLARIVVTLGHSEFGMTESLRKAV